jgi:hypothetical protein
LGARRRKQEKRTPVQQFVALGAVGMFAAYVTRRPIALVAGAAGLAAVVAGLYFFGYFAPRHPSKNQVASDSHVPALPAPPPAAKPQPVVKPASDVAKSNSDNSQRDPALDSWFIKSYLHCWTPPATLPPGGDYAAQIRVQHNADGSLNGAPALVNPPTDPEWRAFSDSAVRAVKKCNPLQVPAQYLPHFEQWKKMTLHFSPDNASE